MAKQAEIYNSKIEYEVIHRDIKYPRFEFRTGKLNELRQLQGLNSKVRIDRACIKNAIKNINSNEYSSLSKKKGGILKKEEKTIEKHTQKENVFSEVA